MAKYRKKPVVIEAIQLNKNGTNVDECLLILTANLLYGNLTVAFMQVILNYTTIFFDESPNKIIAMLEALLEKIK